MTIIAPGFNRLPGAAHRERDRQPRHVRPPADVPVGRAKERAQTHHLQAQQEAKERSWTSAQAEAGSQGHRSAPARLRRRSRVRRSGLRLIRSPCRGSPDSARSTPDAFLGAPAVGCRHGLLQRQRHRGVGHVQHEVLAAEAG